MPRTARVEHLRTCADADAPPGERPPARTAADDGHPDPEPVVKVEGEGPYTPRAATPSPEEEP